MREWRSRHSADRFHHSRPFVVATLVVAVVVCLRLGLPGGHLQRAIAKGPKSCQQLAEATPQALDSSYRPHEDTALTTALPGSEPLIIWTDNITNTAFKKTQASCDFMAAGSELQADESQWQRCRTIHYKVIRGRIFVDMAHKELYNSRYDDHRWGPFEEMLLVTAYLFPLPDMEMQVSYSDEPACGLPWLSYTTRNTRHMQPCTALLMPSYRAWVQALGPQQSHAMSQCLQQRYPVATKIPKAVWRGSDTDPVVGSAHTGNWQQHKRVRLVQTGQQHLDTMDVGFTHFNNAAKETRLFLEGKMPVAGQLSQEEFALYAAILDIDGNSWSSRFDELLRLNSVLIKQAPCCQGYFFHHLRPGVHYEEYEHEVSNVGEVVERVLAEWRHNATRLLGMVHQAQQFAAGTFTHTKVAEALARVLHAYASFLTFPARLEPGFVEVPRSACCRHNRALPRRLVHDICASEGGLAALDGLPGYNDWRAWREASRGAIQDHVRTVYKGKLKLRV